MVIGSTRRSSREYELRWPMVAVLALLVIGFLVYKFAFEETGVPSRVMRTSITHTRERACMTTEALCPAEALCRGANGEVASPAAKTPDGAHCCSFSCENVEIPRRLCTPGERMCPPGQACKMGNTIKSVNAVTPTGESCCTFDCNSDTLENRPCFSSESTCDASSLCYGHTPGSIVQPKARNGSGVCCSYTGSDACVVPL